MTLSIKEAPPKERIQEAARSSEPSDKFKETLKEVAEKKKDPEEEKSDMPLSLQPLMAPPVPLSPLSLDVSTSSSISGVHVVALPAEIEELYEKMAGTMILLSSSLETETRIFLDAPQFASSAFYGTQISIKEFSTAPKAFNIEIATSSAALALLEPHKADLLAFFQKGNFNFSIGRLSTHLHENERPLFHRKEALSGDDEKEREQ